MKSGKLSEWKFARWARLYEQPPLRIAWWYLKTPTLVWEAGGTHHVVQNSIVLPPPAMDFLGDTRPHGVPYLL
jgi:hypothetical protein